MIKACLFDLDGTLLNTLDSIAHHLNGALIKYGIPEVPLSKVRYFVGEGSRVLMRRSLLYRGYSPEDKDRELEAEIYGVFLGEYNRAPSYLVEPYAGITELLSELKAKGIALGVVSNKPHPAAQGAIDEFFPGVFDVVIGGRDEIPLKPDPAMPREACRALGVLPAETLYFGDTGTDMRTGKAYGAALTVGVSWGFREREELTEGGADLIIDAPRLVLEQGLLG